MKLAPSIELHLKLVAEEVWNRWRWMIHFRFWNLKQVHYKLDTQSQSKKHEKNHNDHQENTTQVPKNANYKQRFNLSTMIIKKTKPRYPKEPINSKDRIFVSLMKKIEGVLRSDVKFVLFRMVYIISIYRLMAQGWFVSVGWKNWRVRLMGIWPLIEILPLQHEKLYLYGLRPQWRNNTIFLLFWLGFKKIS